MSSNSDKFETLISFVSHIDDSQLNAEIQKLQHKIKTAENNIVLHGNTDELTNSLQKLEAQVDSLYNRFESVIPLIQEMDTLGINFGKIDLTRIDKDFKIIESRIQSTKAQLQDTYSKLQEFVGSRGEISAPDFSKSGLANIQAWKQQLLDLGATNVVFNNLAIKSATFEEALTGLGIRITKVTQDGTQEFQKLSAAGEALAQTFHNMGDSAFAAFDTMDDPQKLQALSNKIQQIRMNAWSGSQDNKINRETFKMGIADGISKEVASADAALDKFMTAFRNKNNITIEEAQRTAKELGGSLNFSNIVTNQAGEFHASAQLITKDLQTISFSLRSYKEQTEKGDVWGVTTGGVTQLGNIIKQTLGEYQSGLAKSLQLRQQLSQAEQSGNQYAVNLLQQELNLTEQHNAGLRTTLENIQWTQTAMEGLTAAEAQHQQTLNLDAANKQWEQERVAIDNVIQKYNELKQAQLKVQQTSLNNAPKAERQMAMAEQVKATTEFQKAQASLAPHLQNNKRLIDGMADADAKATAATLKLTSAANAQGFSLKALGAQFKTLATNVLQYQLAWKGFQAIIDTIKKVIATTKELDSAMMNIRLVTGQTQEQVHDLMNSYAELGKSVGATATEVSEGAIGWLRQGRTLSETTKLIETSTKLSKLGMMESSEATQLLTATLNGFNVAVSDSESIVDKLVRVDMNFATSTQELATALQYTAASANLAGVSLDQMIGLIATVSATTRRSAESIGQSFKTMFSRLQRVSAGKQLDEYGESLNDVEKRLRTFGIELRNANNEWRNEWEVMSEIGDRWKEFSNVEKSAIAEVMGGTRQRENLLVVFENWDKVLKATTISMNSAGTAEEKYSAYMDSLEAKTKQFTATWQELVNNLSTGDTLKGFVDFGTRILEVVDKFHLLQIAMYTALGAGGFKLFSKGIVALDQALNGVSHAFDVISPKMDYFSQLFHMGREGTEEYARALNNITMQFKAFDPAMQARILNEKVLDIELRKRIADELGLQTAGNGTVITTDMETAATQRLSLAMKNLGSNLQKVWVFLTTNPLGWLILAVGAAVAAVKIFDALTTTFEEHQETISSLNQEYQSLEGELSKLQGELQTTKDRIKELEEASRKGEITLIEAEELRGLRLTNTELERELKLRQAIADAKKQELSKEVMETYNPDFWDRQASKGNVFKQLGYVAKTGQVKTGNPLEDFQNQLNQLNYLKKRLAQVQEQMFNEQQMGASQERLKALQKNINDIQKDIKTLEGTTNDFALTMQENMALLGDTQPEQELKQQMQELLDLYLRITSPQTYFSVKLSELSTKLDDSGKKTKEYEAALRELAEEVLSDKELLETLKTSLDLSDADMEKIKEAHGDFSKLGDIVDKVVNKLDSEELKAEFDIDTSDLEDAEKKVSALASAIDNFKDKSKDLQDALDELNSGGGLSLETISDLAQKFPELEDALTLYLAGVKSDVELQKLLQQEYNKTTNEYKQSLMDKLSTSEEFYNAQIKNNNELNSFLSELYGIDVKNYNTIEQLKAAVARTTEQNIVKTYGVLPTALQPAWDAMLSGFGARCQGMVNWAVAASNAMINAFASVASAQAALVSGGSQGSIKGGLSGANNLGTSGIAQADANAAVGVAQWKIDQILKGVGLGAGKLGGAPTGGGSPSGGSSGGSGEDAWKAEFEAAKAELDHQRKMDLISTKEYYDALNKLVEKYYKGNEKYLSEYKSEEEGLYDLKKELFEQDRNNLEIDLEILENQVGTAEQRLGIYEKIMESAHLQAEELRSLGVKEDTDVIRDLQKIYRDNNQNRLDVLEDIVDEQQESTEHIRNLLEISGNLTVDKELELATQNYQFIIQMYDKYKYIYDKDEKAYRQYIEAKKDATDDLRDAMMASIDKMFDSLDDRVKEAENTLKYAGLSVLGETQKIAVEVDKAFKMGLITLEQYQKYRLELIERERDAVDTAYEKIKNASIKAIEAQIKALQEQKDADDEYYDNKIKSIQTVISAMDKEKDAEDKLLALEKKRYELERAKRQKTVQIYREGVGFIWEANPEDVKKATEDYNDAIRDYNNWQKKLDLQGQIDDFEKAKEANAKIANEQIDKLNKLKEAWENSMDLDEVFDEYEQSLKNLMDDESLSFDQRMAKVNEFTDSYKKKIAEIGQANYDLSRQILALSDIQSPNAQGSATGTTWYATKEGGAPAGAKIGDKILTGGGTYQIVPYGTEGSVYNTETKLSSIKINDIKTVITDANAGLIASIENNTDALLNNASIMGSINDELPSVTGSVDKLGSYDNIPALNGNPADYFSTSVKDTVGRVLSGNISSGYATGTKVTEYAGIVDKATGKEISFASTSNNVYDALKEQGIDRNSVSLAKQTAVTYTVGGQGVSEGVQKDRTFNTSKKGTSRSGSHEEFYGTDPYAYKRAKRGFATGTQSSPATYGFVDEDGEELIVRPPSQGRPTYLEKGTGVIPANITKNLWKIGQNPHEFFQEEFDKQVDRYNGFSWDTSGGAISIVIGDINLKGVQDVDGLSKAIVTRLPNQIIQDLYK